VLARNEVERFLKAVPDLKMRTAFITIYAAGLRVSEVVKLTTRDIDSARMVIIIRQAKGRKDRYVMLSEQLLGIPSTPYGIIIRGAQIAIPFLSPFEKCIEETRSANRPDQQRQRSNRDTRAVECANLMRPSRARP
jgi:integrase